MAEATTDTADTKTKPTPEQVAKMKETMIKNYKEQIEFLSIQSEYEELQARIMEARARQAKAEVIIAQIYSGPDPEDSPKEPKIPEAPSKSEMIQSEEGSSKDTVFRKLKTEIPTK